MAILTIGRVGLDVELNHPSELSESRSIDSREFMLRGFIRSTSVELTKYLRNELLEQQGQVVAVTYSLDSHFDAFYLLAESRIESMETSYLRRGLFLFEVSLFRIGASARVEFQSNITGTVLENTIGLLESEVKPFIAPPPGHQIFSWGTAAVSGSVRVTEDGSLSVFTTAGDFSNDADWGILPSAYYNAAAKILTTDRVRSGLDIPQSPTDWEINNGLIKVVPDATATKFIVSVWDGTSAYESAKTWEPLFDAANLEAFSYVTAVRNDPECVIIRVSTGDTTNKHTLDLQLRRGSAQVFINWFTGGTGNMRVQRDAVEAGTSITPTGASSSAGVRATSNDGDGNRYTIFTPTSGKVDESYGVYVASASRLNVAIGFEIDGTGAAAGNTADDLALQYFGMIGERVRAVWR